MEPSAGNSNHTVHCRSWRLTGRRILAICLLLSPNSDSSDLDSSLLAAPIVSEPLKSGQSDSPASARSLTSTVRVSLFGESSRRDGSQHEVPTDFRMSHFPESGRNTGIQAQKKETTLRWSRFRSPFIFSDWQSNFHESQLLTKYVHENLRRKSSAAFPPHKAFAYHGN